MQVDYNSLRVFGCACWPNLRPYNSHKLAFRSKQCAFLGYSNLHKGFKCLDTHSGRIYISRDVVFDETIFPFAKLNPNARARLRSELLLLPFELLNPSSSWGVQVHDNVSNILPANATNHLSSFQEETMENLGENTIAGGLLICKTHWHIHLRVSSDSCHRVSTRSKRIRLGSHRRRHARPRRARCSPAQSAVATCPAVSCHVAQAWGGGGAGSSTAVPSPPPAPHALGGSGAPPMCPEGDLPGSSAASDPAISIQQQPDHEVPSHPRTRLQSGIRKEKQFTGGTIRYGLLTANGEPNNLEETLGNVNWKNAMDYEFSALQRNKTWHLLPP
jgi:hypothetical protein